MSRASRAILQELEREAGPKERGDFWYENASFLALAYKVPPAEAVRAMDSWFEALDNFIMQKILCVDDYTHLLAILFGEHPDKLLQTILAEPKEVAKMQRNPAGYFEQLSRNLKRKGGGSGAFKALPLYKQLAISTWGLTNKKSPNVPPLCLWTDEAIIEIYDSTHTLAPDAVRQAINRELKLYRPPSVRYRIERHGRDFVRFVQWGEKV